MKVWNFKRGFLETAKWAYQLLPKRALITHDQLATTI